MAEAKSNIQILVSRLSRRTRAVLEEEMRRELVFRTMRELSPENAVEFIHIVMSAPVVTDEKFRPLKMALLDALERGGLEEKWAYEFTAEIYRIATEKNFHEVTGLLLQPSSKEQAAEDEIPLHKDVAKIPLGYRRALAKGIDRNLLEKLLLDADPMVIRNILRNPRIVERDVLSIATRRPIHASSLIEIYRSRRWSKRPMVRLALARNPYMPPAFASRIVTSLGAQALRDLANDNTLHEQVRSTAQREHKRRIGKLDAEKEN